MCSPSAHRLWEAPPCVGEDHYRPQTLYPVPIPSRNCSEPSPLSLSLTLSSVCVWAKSLQSCLTLCDSMDCSPPGSSVHGILRARMLEHVVISFCRGSCQPGIGPASLVSPGLQADSLPPAPPSWGLYIYLKPRHNQASNDTPPETVGDIRRLKHGLAPLIAQLIKNLHAVQETPPRFLGWEDPLEKGDTTHCSIFGLRVAQLVKNLPAMWETWVRKIPWRRERLPT